MDEFSQFVYTSLYQINILSNTGDFNSEYIVTLAKICVDWQRINEKIGSVHIRENCIAQIL